MALCKGKGQGMVVLCLLLSPKLLTQLAWVTFLFEEEIHLIACRRTPPAAAFSVIKKLGLGVVCDWMAIFHETVIIEVDENGTTGAAATGAVVTLCRTCFS
ncbi:hypothetical protein M0R45_028425 [Rubus argutus]|uniref:Secreted protein n=1 Tax=Rubus argutus TaxID=59490 RepID=A0AAW1W4L1_RUBAR